MTAFTATERRADLLAATSHGGAYTVKNLTSTIELAVATLGSTIDFGRIPSNARLLGSSKVDFDSAIGATSKLDLGIAAVNGNLANSDDPDCLSDGHDLSAGGTEQLAITLFADYGNEAWDFVTSETSDPGGVLKLYGSITDASTTLVGTITVSMDYYVD